MKKIILFLTVFLPTAHGQTIKKSSDGSVTISHKDGTSTALQSPAAMNDAIATRLGHKVYLHGTTYKGGIAPTISLFSGGGTLSIVERALFIPYQMQSGEWRLRFSIALTLSSTARTAAVFSVNGVTFRNTIGFAQRIIGDCGSSPMAVRGYANVNASTLELNYASTTTTVHYLSGDVELNSKPTWAY